MVSFPPATGLKPDLAAELAAERARCLALEARVAALEQEVATAQQAAHRHENELLAVLRAIPVATMLLDGNNQVRFVSDECRDMFALPADSVQDLNEQRNASGMLADQRLLADPVSVGARMQAMREANQTSLNNDFALADGRIIAVDYLVLDGGGAGYLLSARDVTKQRRTEQQLVEQQAFYEDVLMHLPSAVSVLDADLRYLFVNATSEPDQALRRAMVGCNTTESYGLRGRSQLQAELRQQRLERAVQQRREVTWEERLLYSGKERCWLGSAQPLFGPDGALRMVMLTGIDISERLRIEQKMAHQREFYEAILNQLPVDIAVFDPAHRYLYANPASIADAEVREQAMGMTNREYCAWRGRPAEVAVQRERVFNQVLRQRADAAWEETVETSTGLQQKMRRLRPVFGADGALRMVVGSGLDVTERYLAERELRRAKLAAEQAALARESFLSNMSHEIRTPLNAVLGMAGLLARNTPLTPRQQEYVGAIRTAGQHLLGVLNDVLDIAKITSAEQGPEHEPFDLAAALHAVGQMLAHQATEKNLALTLDLAPLPWVRGDALRLRQVLVNLLGNALKFTERGTVALRARVLARPAGALTVAFRVTDTGLGIPADRQEAIFESFAQASADTARQFGGTGLGLTISSRLVEQLGGRLLVSSAPGEGTTFAFALTFAEAAAPAPEASAGAGASTPPPAAGVARGLRVLLVEDNELNRQLVQYVLEHQGLVVDSAVNGAGALALFAQARYDVVLMDIKMPDMSGVEVTARIRRDPDRTRARTPIIALTANAFQGDYDKYLAAGMDDHLAKPFEADELLRKIVAVQ
ncbi:response regulator [Hymenobacter nivis]|uniref:histidine kinase n=1 Tax=Hymenobacter nivis TaxID=1850093 RepID=A0A502HE04_9BACT|nr:response regulator [Hymenobacter nivis]TPG71703.1 response regulator [Hymenobacter nivis]